jgi:hypothetical protein
MDVIAMQKVEGFIEALPKDEKSINDGLLTDVLNEAILVDDEFFRKKRNKNLWRPL